MVKRLLLLLMLFVLAAVLCPWLGGMASAADKIVLVDRHGPVEREKVLCDVVDPEWTDTIVRALNDTNENTSMSFRKTGSDRQASEVLATNIALVGHGSRAHCKDGTCTTKTKATKERGRYEGRRGGKLRAAGRGVLRAPLKLLRRFACRGG